MVIRASAFVAAVALLGGVAACGHAASEDRAKPICELVMAYDDNHPSANLAFPNLTYESLIRFELPPGKHQPLRLRALMSGPGTIEIALYANSPLEAPGTTLHRMVWVVDPSAVSTGKDGRWLVSDLRSLSAVEGIVWIGLRKTGGEPTLWTTSTNSGQTFLRDRTPGSTLGILPVRRTPMLRLELL